MRIVNLKGLGAVHRTVVEWNGPASDITEFIDRVPAMALIALVSLNPPASGIWGSLGFSFLIIIFCPPCAACEILFPMTRDWTQAVSSESAES